MMQVLYESGTTRWLVEGLQVKKAFSIFKSFHRFRLLATRPSSSPSAAPLFRFVLVLVVRLVLAITFLLRR